jgi:transcriptional regulator GlxA family with amidase domain
MNYTYGIYLYQGVASLDFVGPYEAFDLSRHVLNAGQVVTIAETDEPITCANGMQVIPQFTFDDHPTLDILLVPGANELQAALSSSRAIDWVQTVAAQVQYVTAVCTGSLILQKAGLLQDKKATTHWMLIDELSKDESVEVLPEMRYVRDGNIVTSQGVSAGIDMALWLLGQLHNPDHSRQVRKLLQYEPAPPYLAEV